MDNTKKITITINDKQYKVDPGQTIMQAADKCGYHIPRLCYHPKLSIEGACRVCIVAGRRDEELRGLVLLPRGRRHEDPHEHQGSPAGPARHRRAARGQPSGRLPHLRARRQLRAPAAGLRDGHPPPALHRRAQALREGPLRRPASFATRTSASSAAAASACARRSRASTAWARPIAASTRSSCRPTTCRSPRASAPPAASASTSARRRPSSRRTTRRSCSRSSTTRTWSRSRSSPPRSGRPSARPSACPSGRNMEGQLVAALRRLGFDYVFDTQFAADLTIMEEGSEFLERLQAGGPLPLITSCSSAWMKYMEQFYPDIHREYLDLQVADVDGVGPVQDLLGREDEDRPEEDPQRRGHVLHGQEVRGGPARAGGPRHAGDGHRRHDPRDGLDDQVRRHRLRQHPAGEVRRAAGPVLRGRHDLRRHRRRHGSGHPHGLRALHGRDPGRHRGGRHPRPQRRQGRPRSRWTARSCGSPSRTAWATPTRSWRWSGRTASGSTSSRSWAAPAAASAAAVSPTPRPTRFRSTKSASRPRAQALYDLDRGKTIRRSHDNPDVQRLYREYLGRPLSEKSHELLHTHYKAKTAARHRLARVEESCISGTGWCL